MNGDGSFRVEEFLEAIASQLDRTQDALRIKSLVRPLTYAIRDFALDLRVFVEMDDEGQVRFRSSGPNDTGASTVSIGFTTITRPMIEENTVELAEVQGPTLDQLGLAPEERRSLEKIGVRNARQLKRLESSSGEGALADFANVPVNRLRSALQAARPQVDRLAPAADDDRADRRPLPTSREPSVRLPRGTRRLRLEGRNLGAPGSDVRARLDGMAVSVLEAGDDHLLLDLGNVDPRGRLEIDLDGAEALAFQLEAELDDGHAGDDPDDPWSPA